MAETGALRARLVQWLGGGPETQGSTPGATGTESSRLSRDKAAYPIIGLFPVVPSRAVAAISSDDPSEVPSELIETIGKALAVAALSLARRSLTAVDPAEALSLNKVR